MAKETVQPTRNTTNWIAIGIAIIALILSILAFANTKNQTPLYPQNEFEAFREETREFQQKVTLEEARKRLEEVRRDIAQGVNAEQIQKELADIREDLRANFQNAGEQAQTAWQNLDTELEKIEDQLREGSINLLNTLDMFLEKLKSGILEMSG